VSDVPPALTPDDMDALGWAVAAGTPTGNDLRERIERGEMDVTAEILSAARAEWDAAGRPPPPARHVHRDAIELADGTSVVAVSFGSAEPYERDELPAFGLYLDPAWRPPWPHDHVDWADFGVPDPDELRAALEVVLARARAGEVVEIGCLGGHGRTGTAVACLAVLVGTPADRAVAWVREVYCERAVETEEQETFVAGFGPSAGGRD
jgi:hypothetical protein